MDYPRGQTDAPTVSLLISVIFGHFYLQVAWAQGKGTLESEYKPYYESEHGTTYIPWDACPKDPSELERLEDGGLLDQETLPEHLKGN